MSVRIGWGSVSDVVNHGRNAAVDNLATPTICIWHRATGVGQGGDRPIFTKSGGGGGFVTMLRLADARQLRCYQIRATTNAQANSNDLAALVGRWSFSCFSFDASIVPHIYFGGTNRSVREVSYATQTTGVGALTDDSTQSLAAGNYGNGAFNNQANGGDIAFVSLFNRLLSLAEMEWLRLRSLMWLNHCAPPPIMPGCVFLCHEGREGVSTTQRDWSGQGLNGTVTGAIQGADPLLGYNRWRTNRYIFEPRGPFVSLPFIHRSTHLLVR